jgi:HAMP domain-containing protein
VFVDGWPLFFALLFLLILLILIALEMWRRHRARQRELETLRAAVGTVADA